MQKYRNCVSFLKLWRGLYKLIEVVGKYIRKEENLKLSYWLLCSSISRGGILWVCEWLWGNTQRIAAPFVETLTRHRRISTSCWKNRLDKNQDQEQLCDINGGSSSQSAHAFIHLPKFIWWRNDAVCCIGLPADLRINGSKRSLENSGECQEKHSVI